MNDPLSTFTLSEGEFVILFWAMIGGIAVFIGLLLEKFAEWMDKRFLGGTHKPHKTLESIGWCILMFGIFIEVVVAGWSANDAWQTRQMAIKNDPRNAIVSDLTADVSIDLRGNNAEWPLYGSRRVADLWLIGTNWHIGLSFLSNFATMESDSFVSDVWADSKSQETSKHYHLRFHTDDMGVDESTKFFVKASPGVTVPMPTVRDIIDRVPALLIDAKFIPHDADVTGGAVIFHINGSIPKYFEIFPQKAFPPPRGLGTNINTLDSGFTLLATNSTVTIVPFQW